MRGHERQTRFELTYLFKEIGDPSPEVDKTGIKGLVVAKTIFSPIDAIEKLRAILQEKAFEFRYSLRILPIEKVVRTNLEDIEKATTDLSSSMKPEETFRVTVEKRFTSIHNRDFIEAAAKNIENKVNLDNPDRILLIEVLGGFTGISLIKPDHILNVQKEKML